MPLSCFSYPADVPPSISNRNADAQPGLRRMPSGPCFSTRLTCRAVCRFPDFSYSADAPLGARNRAAALPPRLARRMPQTCFSY